MSQLEETLHSNIFATDAKLFICVAVPTSSQTTGIYKFKILRLPQPHGLTSKFPYHPNVSQRPQRSYS